MKTKYFTFMAVFVIAAMVLTACGGGATDANAAAGDTATGDSGMAEPTFGGMSSEKRKQPVTSWLLLVIRSILGLPLP